MEDSVEGQTADPQTGAIDQAARTAWTFLRTDADARQAIQTANTDDQIIATVATAMGDDVDSCRDTIFQGIISMGLHICKHGKHQPSFQGAIMAMAEQEQLSRKQGGDLSL